MEVTHKMANCSFHGTKRRMHLPKEGGNPQFYPAMTPMNHINDLHGITILRVL